MFGLKFFKAMPSDYVIQFRNGAPIRKGTGLSFFYFRPNTSMAVIPTTSNAVPFMIEQVTNDFQQVTVQGMISYRVSNPERLAELLDFSINLNTGAYNSEDVGKLPQQIVNLVRVVVQREVKSRDLRDALGLLETLADIAEMNLAENRQVQNLGIEVIGIAVVAIKPVPETARALEAAAREQILKEADDALYGRRNASVEQERRIRENELNTEIAVENKQEQIQRAKLEKKRQLQQSEQEMANVRREFEIEQEAKRQQLVDLVAANSKKEADANAYALQAMMDVFAKTDFKTIQALASVGMKPEQLIANAFQGLAENAAKIGELNISPDLLNQLITNRAAA